MSDPRTESLPAGPAPPPARRRRRWIWWLAALPALLVVLTAGLALWSISDGSLRQALGLAQRFLPADQVLEVLDAGGSLARGGEIATLRWSRPGTAITIESLRLEWSLLRLPWRGLDVRALRASRVHVRLSPTPADETDQPFVMPAQVVLPLRLSLLLEVDRVEIETVDEAGTSSLQVIEDLAARYAFDGTQHQLRLDSLRYGQSRAQADLRLHATELTLRGQVAAWLRDLVPELPFAMRARFQADGTLAGGDRARLQLILNALETARDVPPPDAARLLDELAVLLSAADEEQDLDAPGPQSNAQLRVLATVHPWRMQPVQELHLRVNRLDAAVFHASLPATRIDGEANVEPVVGAAGRTWDLQVALRNGLPGALDARRVPARSIETRARLAEDLLAIETARIALAGAEPAGSVGLSGEVPLGEFERSRLRLQLQRVDLRPVMSTLPNTRLDGEVSVAPTPGMPEDARNWWLRGTVTNALPGPLDEDRLPVERLQADLAMAPELWRAQTLQLGIGGGRLDVRGEFAPATRAVDLRGELARLPLRRIHRDLANDLAAELSGRVVLAGDPARGVDFDADIRSNTATDAAAATPAQWEIRAVQAKGRWSPTRLTVQRVHVDAFQALIDGSGIDASLPDLDTVRATVKAVAPGLVLDADASMRQQSGGGRITLDVASADQTMAWLDGLPLVGGNLGALQASGAAQLQAQWQGGWRQWANGLRRPAQYRQLQLDASLTSQGLDLELPAGEGGSPTLVQMQALDASVKGNLAAASLVIDGDMRVNDTAAVMDVRVAMASEARGTQSPRWQFTFEQFSAEATLPDEEAPWRVEVSEGLVVNLQAGSALSLQATAGELTLSPPAGFDARGLPMQVSWEPLRWDRAANGAVRLDSRGAIAGMQPGWLDVLRDEQDQGLLERSGLRTDLLLSASWNLSLADTLTVDAKVQRDEGDIWLLGPQISDRDLVLQAVPERGQSAGLRVLDLALHSEDEAITLDVDWQTEYAGEITASLGTRAQRGAGGWEFSPQMPLTGRIEARLRDLGVWGILAPPGWRMRGRVDADIDLEGTLQSPRLTGSIAGDELNVRSVLDGVELHQGSLRAALTGQQLRIESLTFQGGTGSKAYVSGISGNRTQAPRARGSMTATGLIDWSGAGGDAGTGITMDMEARLAAMQVLVRNDRQLTLSGELSAALADSGLRVRGDLHVDRATILLPEAGAPTLGDDVVIVRDDDPLELIEVGATRMVNGGLETARPMDVQIGVDLGDDLALHGMGITTRLEGELSVRSSGNPGQPFIVFGEVRTDEGRYRAWGQALDVETGIVVFNGSYLNPSLNLLAIRPEIEVRAGVRVTGSLSAPRVVLYSEPPLPQAEILSWVVLGRATAVAGGEGSSMQRAALGLLAGSAVSSLSDDLGVDELGLDESALSIGKRLSNELYVTYAAGLSGAASTLYIFYDITRKLTLRGQAGEASAADLIYTISFD